MSRQGSPWRNRRVQVGLETISKERHASAVQIDEQNACRRLDVSQLAVSSSRCAALDQLLTIGEMDGQLAAGCRLSYWEI
jgi:hypothetical protein